MHLEQEKFREKNYHTTPLNTKDILDKSSEINRNLGLFMIVFLFYLLIAIAGITDRQLLTLAEGINLPLINISLPLTVFAWSIPIIILFIHLNVLLNLLEHSSKLISWIEGSASAKYEKEDNKIQDQLHPFLFNYTVINKNQFTVFLSKILVNFCVFFFPLLVLFFLEFRFADLHSKKITNWHFAIFILDFLLVFSFYKAIFKKTKLKISNLLRISALVFLYRSAQNFIIWILNFFSKKKKEFKNTKFVQVVDQVAYWSLFFLAILYLFLVHLIIDKPKVVVCYVKGDGIVQAIRLYFNSSLYNSYNFLQLTEEEGLIQIPRITLAGQTLAISSPSLNETLLAVKNDTNVHESEISIKYTTGINLTGRDLTLARFENCKFINANFAKCQMEYAYFDNCDCSAASFQNAELFHSEFWFSILNKTNFTDANFDYAVIQHTSALQINFARAELKYSRFSAEVCDTGSTKLTGASFWFSDLYKSVIQGDLRGTDFTNSKLDSAVISGDISGGNFHGSALAGTDFGASEMGGCFFDIEQLQKCQFSGEQIQAAYFNSALLADSSTNQDNSVKFELFTNQRIKLLSNRNIPIRHIFTSETYFHGGLKLDLSNRHNQRLFSFCKENNINWRIEEYENLDNLYKYSIDGLKTVAEKK